MSGGQEIGSPIRENRTLLPAPLPPDEARGTLAAAAGVSTVGLRPPFNTPAAAFSSCLSRPSHPDCRAARKVVAFAREEPDLYDPEFQEYFQDLIERLDPMPTRMGALPPNPRDI